MVQKRVLSPKALALLKCFSFLSLFNVVGCSPPLATDMPDVVSTAPQDCVDGSPCSRAVASAPPPRTQAAMLERRSRSDTDAFVLAGTGAVAIAPVEPSAPGEPLPSLADAEDRDDEESAVVVTPPPSQDPLWTGR